MANNSNTEMETGIPAGADPAGLRKYGWGRFITPAENGILNIQTILLFMVLPLEWLAWANLIRYGFYGWSTEAQFGAAGLIAIVPSALIFMAHVFWITLNKYQIGTQRIRSASWAFLAGIGAVIFILVGFTSAAFQTTMYGDVIDKKINAAQSEAVSRLLPTVEAKIKSDSDKLIAEAEQSATGAAATSNARVDDLIKQANRAAANNRAAAAGATKAVADARKDAVLARTATSAAMASRLAEMSRNAAAAGTAAAAAGAAHTGSIQSAVEAAASAARDRENRIGSLRTKRDNDIDHARLLAAKDREGFFAEYAQYGEGIELPGEGILDRLYAWSEMQNPGSTHTSTGAIGITAGKKAGMYASSQWWTHFLFFLPHLLILLSGLFGPSPAYYSPSVQARRGNPNAKAELRALGYNPDRLEQSELRPEIRTQWVGDHTQAVKAFETFNEQLDEKILGRDEGTGLCLPFDQINRWIAKEYRKVLEAIRDLEAAEAACAPNLPPTRDLRLVPNPDENWDPKQLVLFTRDALKARGWEDPASKIAQADEASALLEQVYRVLRRRIRDGLLMPLRGKPIDPERAGNGELERRLTKHVLHQFGGEKGIQKMLDGISDLQRMIRAGGRTPPELSIAGFSHEELERLALDPDSELLGRLLPQSARALLAPPRLAPNSELGELAEEDESAPTDPLRFAEWIGKGRMDRAGTFDSAAVSPLDDLAPEGQQRPGIAKDPGLGETVRPRPIEPDED